MQITHTSEGKVFIFYRVYNIFWINFIIYSFDFS